MNDERAMVGVKRGIVLSPAAVSEFVERLDGEMSRRSVAADHALWGDTAVRAEDIEQTDVLWTRDGRATLRYRRIKRTIRGRIRGWIYALKQKVTQ